MRDQRIVVCLLVAVSLTVLGCGYSGPKFSVQELKVAMDDPSREVTVIDVRPGVLFRKGHIPGSKNCPLEKLEEKRADIASINGEVALICTCGKKRACRREAAERARHQNHPRGGRIQGVEESGVSRGSRSRCLSLTIEFGVQSKPAPR